VPAAPFCSLPSCCTLHDLGLSAATAATWARWLAPSGGDAEPSAGGAGAGDEWPRPKELGRRPLDGGAGLAGARATEGNCGTDADLADCGADCWTARTVRLSPGAAPVDQRTICTTGLNARSDAKAERALRHSVLFGGGARDGGCGARGGSDGG